ncbi:MAG: flagellar basal body-associated FliL family protein [Lachnospiraceae bacterium]|nr:flagellar basal body-associated FliL family protein [Lachnospiraceae bacterium]MDE7358180.1 flagellar basal body-associated FliL family protein [Lachnospiraceae bacterium]
MKKNMISVIILALLIVNIVLTAIMMFSVTGASRKTAALVDNIATALNLELSSGTEDGGAAEAVSMADTETYSFAENMTIPLKKSEGDDKDHYCIVSITLSINTKAEGYKEFGSAESLATREGLIKDEINGVFAQYTMEEARDNQEEIKKEIINRIQTMFDSKFIYNVSFGDIMFG